MLKSEILKAIRGSLANYGFLENGIVANNTYLENEKEFLQNIIMTVKQIIK